MDVLVDWAKTSYYEYGPKLLDGLAVLLLGWLVARLATGGLKRMLKRARFDATLAGFCSNLVYVTLLTLVVITALSRFGFPAVSFAAVLGAAGLAIGLALKGALSKLRYCVAAAPRGGRGKASVVRLFERYTKTRNALARIY